MPSHQESLITKLADFGYSTDTFIATWDSTCSSDCRTRSSDVKLPLDEICEITRPLSVKLFTYGQIKENFHHSKFKIKPEFLGGAEKFHMIDGYLSSGVSQSFLVYHSNLLKTEQEQLTGVKYDLVFSVRPDFKIDKLVIEQNDKLNLMDTYRSYSASDMFAYGSSFVMDNYSSVFTNLGFLLEEYDGKGQDNDQRPQFAGFEQMIFRHIQQKNIEFNVSNVSISRA